MRNTSDRALAASGARTPARGTHWYLRCRCWRRDPRRASARVAKPHHAAIPRLLSDAEHHSGTTILLSAFVTWWR